jgi:predicted DNA-binding protein with PD1-like motif
VSRAVASAGGRALSLRMEPGEDVGERLCRELDLAAAAGAAVAAAIGSLRELTYAVASPSAETLVAYRDRQRLLGAIEVCALHGHVGRDETGAPGFHLHGVFALDDGRVVGGHVFAARVLATLEVTLLLADGVAWCIEPFVPPGCAEAPPGLRAFVPRPR